MRRGLIGPSAALLMSMAALTPAVAMAPPGTMAPTGQHAPMQAPLATALPAHCLVRSIIGALAMRTGVPIWRSLDGQALFNQITPKSPDGTPQINQMFTPQVARL